ncbi:MAG TPA: BON domain-containing protein [Jiangellales bacterium]|nr:BON domain-containing protein [Jiangellales bacterium]
MGTLVRLAALGGLAYAVKRYVDQNSGARQRLRDGARSGSADADDATVEARVRAQLGPLEKRLDVPRVQVGVVGGQVTLHGEVPTREAARTLENAAREVRGVSGLESHLAVGLSWGATRPSAGRPARDGAVPAGV